jgi:hypothetical protein
MANLPSLRIGIEACGSAHYWARRFREHGHEARLIAPQLSTEVFWQLYDEYLTLEQRVAYYHEKLTAMARTHPVCQHIYTGSYPLSRSIAQAIRLPSVEREPELDAGVLPTTSSSWDLRERVSQCWHAG